MCGGKLGKRRRVYCCDECADRYRNLFFWPWASMEAFRRANRKCQRCGITDRGLSKLYALWWPEKAGLQVHHIIPVRGEDRTWHRLNIPSNLLVVCHDCHVLLHTPSRLRELDHQRMQPVLI